MTNLDLNSTLSPSSENSNLHTYPSPSSMCAYRSPPRSKRAGPLRYRVPPRRARGISPSMKATGLLPLLPLLLLLPSPPPFFLEIS